MDYLGAPNHGPPAASARLPQTIPSIFNIDAALLATIGLPSFIGWELHNN